MRGSILLVVLLGAGVASAGGGVNPPPSAADVLAGVQKYYANAPQLFAKFRQKVTNKAFGTAQQSDGKVWVTKPSNFRWDYLVKTSKGVSPAKSFIYDGKTLWMIEYANKRATYGTANGALPAAVSFLTGGANLATQFTVAVDISGTYASKGATVLALTPKQASAGYTKLFFVVDDLDSSIRESIVINSNGETSDFAFFDPDIKTPIKPSLFTVNPAKLKGYAIQKMQAQQAPAAAAGSAAPPPATAAPSPPKKSD